MEKCKAVPWLHGWINGEANGIGWREIYLSPPLGHLYFLFFASLLFLWCVLEDSWAHGSHYIHYRHQQPKDTWGLLKCLTLNRSGLIGGVVNPNSGKPTPNSTPADQDGLFCTQCTGSWTLFFFADRILLIIIMTMKRITLYLDGVLLFFFIQWMNGQHYSLYCLNWKKSIAEWFLKGAMTQSLNSHWSDFHSASSSFNGVGMWESERKGVVQNEHLDLLLCSVVFFVSMVCDFLCDWWNQWILQ